MSHLRVVANAANWNSLISTNQWADMQHVYISIYQRGILSESIVRSSRFGSIIHLARKQTCYYWGRHAENRLLCWSNCWVPIIITIYSCAHRWRCLLSALQVSLFFAKALAVFQWSRASDRIWQKACSIGWFARNISVDAVFLDLLDHFEHCWSLTSTSVPLIADYV